VKQQTELRAAADAAVAEAAAAAAATEAAELFNSTVDGPPYGRGVDLIQGTYWMTPKLVGGKFFAREYSSRLHAACAADLAQLALGRTAANLPGASYTPQQVAAMRQLLQFERPGWFEPAAARSSMSPEAAARLKAVDAAARDIVAAAAVAAAEAAPEQAAAYRAASRQQ
jgi:hypothetical protein